MNIQASEYLLIGYLCRPGLPNDHNVDIGQGVLMVSKTFPDQPFQVVPGHRGSYSFF